MLAYIASECFSDTNVNLTAESRPVLGSPIGTSTLISTFVKEKVQEWVDELEVLTNIADRQPHAAYSLSPMVSTASGIISQELPRELNTIYNLLKTRCI